VVMTAELLAGAALAMARTAGLCATAPLLGDPELPRRLRVGFVVLLGATLAPLHAAAASSLGVDLALATGATGASLAALVPALATELALGLCIGAAARFTLAAAELAGQLAGISLGLGFAEQYDPARGEATVAGQRLARTIAALAFLYAGGLDALVRAAATPASPAALDQLPAAAEYALRMATLAATLGLGLAAPLLLAALLANLAVALANRTAAAVNLFTVGLAASLLAVGAALLVAAPQLAAGFQTLAERAAIALANGLTQGGAP
jgi:flagellar biosynthesis protein FliR